MAAEITEPEIEYIAKSLERVARDEKFKLDAVIASVEIDSVIENTNVITHCHILQLDGDGNPRVADLIAAMCDRVTDYAFPRSKLKEARDRDSQYGGNANITRLARDAAKLFTNLTQSGEGGELLLFVLAEEYLKLPQIITKMSLKTNPQMHFHGADGVYASVVNDKLCLYWGESKIHADPTNAVYECLKSLADFLKGGMAKRDFQLLQDYLDLDDPKLEAALKNYLDRTHPNSNQIESRGIALVGFDDDDYPKKANTKELKQLHAEILAKIPKWKKHISKRTGEEEIETFHFHVFMIPMPNVESFRQLFRKELGIA